MNNYLMFPDKSLSLTLQLQFVFCKSLGSPDERQQFLLNKNHQNTVHFTFV